MKVAVPAKTDRTLLSDGRFARPAAIEFRPDIARVHLVLAVGAERRVPAGIS